MEDKGAASPVTTERTSIYAAFITGFTALAFSLIYFINETPPLFGRYSIGLTTAFLAAIVTFILFVIAWRVPKGGRSSKKAVRALQNGGYWVKRSAVAFVHAALVFLLLSALFYLLQHAFKGLELSALVASVIVAITVGSVSYMVYPLIRTLTLENLSVILATFLGVGVLTSAMSMQDATWWQYHFSSLGAGNPVAAVTFNITLIVAGIVVVAITQLVTDTLKEVAIERHYKSTKGISTARIMLMITGLGLACVGLFPFDDYLTIHNIAASGMAIMFIALIAGLPKFIPLFDRSFYTLSYSMLAGIVISTFLFINGYLNLTAFELVAAGVIFSWFIVFVRQIATLQPSKKLGF